MNGFNSELIKMMIKQKKYESITEYTNIMYPDKNTNLVIQEYVGDCVRVYKSNDNVNVLCPRDISTVQEGALAKAIENGTIFDDADTVDNGAKYIELTTLPYKGMCNKGIDIPEKLHKVTSIVIGRMDDDGRCGQCEEDFDTGNKFFKDAINHVDNNLSVADVVKHYVGKDNDYLNTELKRDMRPIHDEIESIKNISHEDSITDNDWSYMDMDGSDEGYYSEDDDDDVVQEGVISAIKVLKKLDYDPKTKTIITDIPVAGAKKGERVRVNFKINSLESLVNGPCMNQPDGTKESATIHIPINYLLGDGTKLYELIKHEEGHVAVRYDPDRFKKDFNRANRYVEKYKDKLKYNDHGLNPEEYVADLYAARRSGTKGESLVKFFKQMKINYTKMHTATINQCKQFIRKGIELKKQIYHSNITSSDEQRYINKYIEDDMGKTSDLIDVLINQIDQILYFRKLGKKVQDELIQASIKKSKESTVKLKTKIEAVKILFRDKCDEKKFTQYLKELKEAFDDTMTHYKSCINEMDMRIAAVRKGVNMAEYAVEDNNSSSVIIEGFLTKRPKKLKPITRDVVAYITVEMNAIRTSNDQAMLAGYTCSKLELVDFYITVIDTQDSRYIVPHTRDYLVRIQAELNDLLTKILRIKPINRNDRVWKVNLPEEWRG